MLYDLDRSAFVGDAGMLPSRPDDEISRKLAMLIEGECTRLGPTKAGLMKWPEFGRFGGNLVLQNCRAPSYEFRLCVRGVLSENTLAKERDHGSIMDEGSQAIQVVFDRHGGLLAAESGDAGAASQGADPTSARTEEGVSEGSCPFCENWRSVIRGNPL